MYRSGQWIDTPEGIGNTELQIVIKEIFEDNKQKYGVHRTHKELLNRGYQVNHKRVQHLMHKARLRRKRPKEKHHSYKGEVGKIAEKIINRDFSTTTPLQKWITDFIIQFPLHVFLSSEHHKKLYDWKAGNFSASLFCFRNDPYICQ